ncbi:diacylglycerol kinase family protein [Polaribacter sp.]|uniref:diacylglycerol/lipid kinase family protein n=1 Tax=Polaribacter sp. TaxID=1920175 RepID=UPI0025F2BB4E|nr:diacylglycerol kinase family protein [Polaribacter sp.]
MSEFINQTDENSWFIIANPTAGNKIFNKQWKEIKTQLSLNNISYSFSFTAFSKHEIELVQQAIQKGFRKIISVGGDGTLHHVVNGIMLQTYVKTTDITIGVIPIGTGNDLVKTYKIPNNTTKAIKIIKKNSTILQDVGLCKTVNNTFDYFINVAGIGFDGYVIYKLNNLKKFGAIGYLLAGINSLLSYNTSKFKISFNNKIIETKSLLTIVGICKYAGGGLQFTNNVDPADGLFDITIVKNIKIITILLNINKLFKGSLYKLKKISNYKSSKITIESSNTTTYIQADGELIGTNKVSFNVIKKAIRFIVNT